MYDKANKSWTTSKKIRNVFVMGGGAQPNNTGDLSNVSFEACHLKRVV